MFFLDANKDLGFPEVIDNWMLLWVLRFGDFGKLRVSKYSKNFTIYPCKTAL